MYTFVNGLYWYTPFKHTLLHCRTNTSIKRGEEGGLVPPPLPGVVYDTVLLWVVEVEVEVKVVWCGEWVRTGKIK